MRFLQLHVTPGRSIVYRLLNYITGFAEEGPDLLTGGFLRNNVATELFLFAHCFRY